MNLYKALRARLAPATFEKRDNATGQTVREFVAKADDPFEAERRRRQESARAKAPLKNPFAQLLP